MAKVSSAYRKAYYEKRIAFYKVYLGGKCVRCSSTQNLQFDHIIAKDKLFTISSKYDARWPLMRPELEKCQLLCEECHIAKGQQMGDVKAAAIHGSLGMYRHYKCRCKKLKRKLRSRLSENSIVL